MSKEEKFAGCIFGPANGHWVRYSGEYYVHDYLEMPGHPSPVPAHEVIPSNYPHADKKQAVYREFWLGLRRVLVPHDWEDSKVYDALLRYSVVGWRNRGRDV